ncbi:MAG TPA: transglycosylase SLT domain-containing protein, partial [Candidatus Binataceae bacterium]|nr:transglycosylase SLT domain-containing protein [Candidatus Binataceae bacterium]
LVEARAQIALGNPKAAYENAMVLRTRYPLSDEDAMAREIAYAVIAANPGVADARSVKYHREESELLLREGAISKAAVQAQSGLAIATNPGDRAELTYTLARALKPNPADAAREFLKYLRIAPRGPDAPAALEKLALIYWHDDRDELARGTFGRIVAEFPHSRNAPGAMLRIGRIFEEQHQLGRARAQYKRVAARYPSSEAGETARFRAPWMLYMGHDYSHAAAEFGAARKRASSGSERDRCDYWRARSLEKAGDASGALAIFSKVALSVESNYYPALAARRAAGSRPELPAATISESVFDAPAPAVASEIEQFHLDRLATLRALNLKQLEPDELRALHEAGGGSSAMSRFVLGGYIRAGAWHDSIAMALRMEKSRELDRAAAERAAYPRGYWDLIAPAAARRALDPYMLLALMRQESLFNPRATSASNARGLMQLLPSTAARVATQEAIESGNLDLYDPPLNVTLGTAYLAQLFAMFGGDEFKAVAAYNGGEHAVQKWTAEFPGSDDEWVENIAYAETRDYVKRVIGGRREYQLLYQAPSGSGAR